MKNQHTHKHFIVDTLNLNLAFTPMKTTFLTKLVPTTTATLLTLMVLAGTLVSCSSAKTGKNSGSVQHVVLCWLKNSGDATTQQNLIDASYAFKSIPGVVEVYAGRTLPSEREAVDDSFDVGIIIVLESREALKEYAVHPIHTKAVKELLQPVTERLLIYDIVEE